MSGKINKKTLKTDENIPDNVRVPDKKILLLTNHESFDNAYNNILVPGEKKRPWFTDFFYFCLPLSMGNQHGFIVHSMYDVLIRWRGADSTSDLSVFVDYGDETHVRLQTFESHFGSGILTMQMQYTMRTPENVNILVKEPPNYPLPTGLSVMNAVVETDQLRRDFTFNFKVTEPHYDIFIPKGTPLASVLPYPRYFHDGYEVEVSKDANELDAFRKTLEYYTKERQEEYKAGGAPSLRYMKGEDIFGNMFTEHQKSLDGGRWWSNVKRKRDKED
jgi:hypothetical protein